LQVVLVCVFLALAVLAVFGQTARFGFVNYDDNKYIYENEVVQKGLTWQGVRWALTYSEIGHWHPLTWLTHMADCQFYGLRAGGHHATNVALHLLTTLLLFLVLRQMTGRLWRSAFVAAVFAIHPLRAESVAWIAERKDVLSGMFFMLTLLAYVHYVRQPSIWRYLLLALSFALGLLSKNMLVTLPFVLLLLDWWPLGRMEGQTVLVLFPDWWKLAQMRRQRPGGAVTVSRLPSRLPGFPFWVLVKEKIPLLALSAGSCVATALVAEKLGDVDRVSLLPRLGNAVVSYAIYLRQMVFPVGLAAPYPYPHSGPPIWEICVALVVLAVVTVVVFVWRQKRPFLLVGWLWYLGMLVPAIGIVQISYYSHADRYTYLPEIGLAIAGTWAVTSLSAKWQNRRTVLRALMIAVIGALAICAHTQTSYWKDGESLWTHTLACTSNNFVAHLDLADLLRLEGKLDEATAQYRLASDISPDNVETINDLGIILGMKGQDAAAIAQFQKALAIRPGYADTYVNLGNVLMHVNLDEAIADYRKALAITPDKAEILNNLGKALGMKGDDAAAIAQYQRVLEIQPGYANAHFNLANRLLKVGRLEEAAAQYQQALEIQPNDAEARNKLGKTLLLKGDFDGAMSCFEKTTTLSPDPFSRWLNVGSGFLQQDDWQTAIVCFHQALKINPRSAEAYANLGMACFKKGGAKEAIDSWQQALSINPDQVNVQISLARLLATTPDTKLRDGPKAIALATQANQLSKGGNPVILQTLAVIYAQAGNYGEAASTARRALELALAQNQDALAAALQKEIKLYETNTPPNAPK
jgi:tetratricopeptide (TPR) repeat protein